MNNLKWFFLIAFIFQNYLSFLQAQSFKMVSSLTYRHLRLKGDCYVGLLPPDRWQDYKKLRLEMLLKHPKAFGGSYEEELEYDDEQWQNYLTEAINESKTILVFFLKENLVLGMAGVKIGTTFKTAHKATLFSVYVLPGYRGLGIGKTLISTIIEKLQSKSIKKIEAIVGVEQIPSIGLYSRFNFSIEGLLRNFWFVDHDFCDVYHMGLVLN